MYVAAPSLATLTTGVACAITICWIGRKAAAAATKSVHFMLGRGFEVLLN